MEFEFFTIWADHYTSLRRLTLSYGLGGPVLTWFESYLANCVQRVRRRTTTSTPSILTCGVPQGSVLGPILFLLYTADILRIVELHGLSPHLYADDTQIYGSCSPSDVVQCQQRVSSCIDDVAEWMMSNR